ncbi:SusC/RagA family TonB-linked outer membrane protein, partial [Escherichia coli]|nr:SusC/RagA family TonB-linked outer membrane protein [Escherichia coli]
MTNLFTKSLRRILMLLLVCCMNLTAFAQNELRGTVSDQSGTGLIGITVTNQTQNLVSKTNEQGNFTINAKISDVIIFSSIGYLQKSIKITDLKVLEVKLEQSGEDLDEVVVLGHGSIKKSNLTGSVSRLDKRVLETGVRANPASALAGTIPGLRVQQASGRPGSVANSVLRGGTTYGGGGSPLVIVDGLIRSGFSDINQDDIESIDVLKDASATAIYGARASNGVVLITTKRGKEGVSNISLKSKVGVNSLNIPFEFLGAKDYLYWSRSLYRFSG